MNKRTLITLFLIIMVSFFAEAQERITGKNFASRSEVLAKNGMVATSQPLAAEIGIEILKQGGTAVDAAIAVDAALGLMEPTGAGIGGDLFAIVWDAKSQKLYGINASGPSPKSLSLDYFRNEGITEIPATGPLPVNVPGAVDGWFELHKKFGKLSMKEILSPTIKYAEEGFPVSELIAYYFQSVKRFMEKGFLNVEETYTVDGKIPKKGDVFKNPFLAKTYKRIANEGRDAFYKGEIAKTIDEFIHEQGGFLSTEDLADFHAEWVDPISTNYRGYDVWELPPNGQGLATLQMLNIIEGFDFSAIRFGDANHIRIVNEAKKLVYEDIAKYYADPNFSHVPIQGLLSKEYAAERRKLIDENRPGEYVAGNPDHSSTVYMTTADKEGNMVSLIQSNYRGMGSGMVPPELGFMLQDRGELFNLEEGYANTYEPGKRPFHTIIPGFVTKDGDPYMSFGVMGGDFQPQGHVQILMNLIDFGMNVQEAGDAPRFEHVGSSDVKGKPAKGAGEIMIENGFDFDEIQKLIRRGYKIGYGGYYGGYQAIKYDPRTGVYYGASESRKDGGAIGY